MYRLLLRETEHQTERRGSLPDVLTNRHRLGEIWRYRHKHQHRPGKGNAPPDDATSLPDLRKI